MFKTLLVDDEAVVLHMLAAVLAQDEFMVTSAGSAAEAAAILAREKGFEIVVTDMKMETPLAGLDVVKAASQAVPRPLIVLLTAFPVPASDWKAAGADALLMKGENTLSLPKQLKALIEKHASGSAYG